MARRKKQAEESQGSTFEPDQVIQPTPDSNSESTKEKISLAPVATLAILLGLISSCLLVFSNSSEPHTYTPADLGRINIELTLSSKQFLIYSNGNVCDGAGELSGLRKASVLVVGDGWTNKTSLGVGDLNTKGECIYTPSFQAPNSFNGGEVTASVIFSFGESEDFKVDLGDKQPFKNLLLSINLG